MWFTMMKNLWHTVKLHTYLSLLLISDYSRNTKLTNLACVITSFCFIVLRNLVNLKVVDLSECSKLEEMPDLSKATNLEVLILRHRSMLASVHPSIFFQAKLEKLDLYYCRSLIILATDSHEKPMADNSVPQTKYDVFVSFRGVDIRCRFLSHLIDTFQSKQINAFVDDKLERGEEIWPSLVKAIEGSSISLIIFSQDYASSRWCLEELVTILECREKYGQIVIPVFYHVDPTHVRYQSSESYKDAFAEHARKYKTKVQFWRHALNKSAAISGIDSSKFRDDDELLKDIVNLVVTMLCRPLVNSKELVGIDKKIVDVESLIRKEPKETRLIGIWGMGGMGKTTLAQEVFNKLRNEYQSSYFLANEREQSSKSGIISLRKEIFSELLGRVQIDTPNSLPNDRIRRMKVLIVLDDVNDFNHLEKLLGSLDNFGSGTRILVTTRDEQVLIANKANQIYRLRELSFNKALELFNMNAFNQSDHEMEYEELSKRVVDYAKGIPLALKVLAYRLRGKEKQVWESELDKLEKMPLPEVYDIMKLSYDDLDRKEQHIFLDLACFFLAFHMRVNVDHLKSLLRDGESDNSVVVGLERLKDKALITFSQDNTLSMHDSLKEMAWEIVRRESIEDPGSRSRLWDFNDIYEVLKNNKGTGTIRSIRIHLPTIKKQKLSPRIFAKMSKIRFLEISVEDNDDCLDPLDILCTNPCWPMWQCWPKQQKSHIADILAKGLKFLGTELRFLCWYEYPLKSLPKKFSAEQLVILKLPNSRMVELWDGEKNLVNLKELDLSGSKKLKELPNLSKASNLEVLALRDCSMLTRVHPSIFSLTKLEKLDLLNCKSLIILACDSHLHSLSFLNLAGCENLKEFSVISKNMKKLRLECTKVKTLPSSFGHQKKLISLHLTGSDIERLPSSINNFTQLLHLDMRYCSKLQTITELPPFLKTLNTMKCESLHTLPEFPWFLETLDARDCKSLKTVLFPSTAVEQLRENRRQVLFWNCLNLDEHTLVAIGLNAQINMMKFANNHLSTLNQDHGENYNDYDHDENYGSYQAIYVYPGSSIPEWFEYKTTKCDLIIDLSSSPPSTFWGFIFCFVLGKYKVRQRIEKLDVYITVIDGEGEVHTDYVGMYIDYGGHTMELDHVCVMYDQRCSIFINSRAKNQTRFKIVVQIDPRFTYRESFYAQAHQVLKGFGVSPITISAYNNFIQQMELGDSMSQFH
ncbi:putative disease resistance protein, partial [Mucuna pruriens]